MKEKWKDVPDYEQFYKCSNTGKIYSKRQKRILKGYKDNGGYMSLSLKKNNSHWKQRRSRIIYFTFKEKINSLDLIHHKDENKLNDKLDNLQKTNRSEHKKRIHPNIGSKTRFKQKYNFNKREILKLYEKHSTIYIAKVKGCNQKTIERFIKKHTGQLLNHYKKRKITVPFSET